MRILFTIIVFASVDISFSQSPRKILVAVDENLICIVKNQCEKCLSLPQCSWCAANNVCFPKQVGADFCKGEILDHEDLGLSLEETANCLCRASKNVSATTCYPPREDDQVIPADEPVCSGRGKCVCGRCFCDPQPDPEYPTKMIMGEHCEFDNFSCQEECNEGPYLNNTYIKSKNDAAATTVNDADENAK